MTLFPSPLFPSFIHRPDERKVGTTSSLVRRSTLIWRIWSGNAYVYKILPYPVNPKQEGAYGLVGVYRFGGASPLNSARSQEYEVPVNTGRALSLCSAWSIQAILPIPPQRYEL